MAFGIVILSVAKDLGFKILRCAQNDSLMTRFFT